MEGRRKRRNTREQVRMHGCTIVIIGRYMHSYQGENRAVEALCLSIPSIILALIKRVRDEKKYR